jgi:hypothetical protein
MGRQWNTLAASEGAADPPTGHRHPDEIAPTREDRLYCILLRLVEQMCCGLDNEDIDDAFSDAIGMLEGAGYLAYDLRDAPEWGQVFITEAGQKFAAWCEAEHRKRVWAELARGSKVALALFPEGPPYTREQLELVERAMRGDA